MINKDFLARSSYEDETRGLGTRERLERAQRMLEAVKFPGSLDWLQGTIGAQPWG